MENIGIIYCLTSPSGKKYIGQCVNFKRRMQRYKCKDCKKQPKIYRAICKYGFENFIDKGIIPPPKDLKHNRLSIQRKNSTGWQFSRIV